MRPVKILSMALSWVLSVLAAWLCPGGIVMAAATDLPDAGVTESGSAGEDPKTIEGIATETAGREYGDEEMYQKDVDQYIVRIRPMVTPIDNISRHAQARKTASFEVKYYSIGTRPIKTTLNTAVTAQTSGTSVSLDVSDTNIFSLDDTILVKDVKGVYDCNGKSYVDDLGYDEDQIPDLELCVCGIDSSTGLPTVYAVNGNLDGNGVATYVPDIEAGATLIRMGKACAEIDMQTGRFNNIPTADVQYCQNFMLQLEQSTFDKIAKKEVNWGMSDLELDAMYDFRKGQELSFLFGVKNKIAHSSKNGALTWFTGGIWYMAGKDITVGRTEDLEGNALSEVTIFDDDLVDISKDLFVGTGNNKRKILFCGSDFLAALSKIKSDKFRLKDTVKNWNLEFKSWQTDFGEILTIHHELLDEVGRSEEAFALDPEYLAKRTHLSFGRNVLDLKKAGVRNTDAVVLQEVCCLYLRYPKAHARMKLVEMEETTEETTE